jgi:branched-chain amino acid transport system ATP-binding protein
MAPLDRTHPVDVEHIGESPALEVVGASKRYGQVVTLNDVTLTVAVGSFHAVIGPNGAGKSTLFAIIMGRLRHDRGQVLVFGRDVTRLRPDQRCALGMTQTFQKSLLFDGLSARENVAMAVRRARGLGHRGHLSAYEQRSLDSRVGELLQLLGLEQRGPDRADKLSHGERRQLELAVSIACEARVLLLDEPMAGLSADQRSNLISRLRELRPGRTFVFVEHDMDSVRALADRVTVLANGVILCEGTMDEVVADDNVRELYLRRTGDAN